MRRLLIALLIVPTLALAACGDDGTVEEGDAGTTSTAAQTTATADATATPEAESASALPEGCTDVDAPQPKGEQSLDAPKDRLDAGKTYTVTFTTNCGAFDVRLDVRGAPKTSASIAALVKDGFYDGLTFHRIVPGFVIQGGDPLGDGQGGPGYSVVEAPKSSARYTKGVVAMAKTQIEDPGTSGSQFFVVSGDDAGLPPDYAVLGKVTKGLGVVTRIESVPVGPGDVPLAPVVISKATLKVS
ncbi:peptidylprolyl isomerase [Conexibacter sp. W3-3-2]|uniref:peptidylprolyl isomerase n=1 Tax=Conexibacter sp. W3-3-2 TaxID=2675227 RepID=UPI0012B9DF11|nr:peptidylprolyl isomerase [Conexibacter sp. W3-3-2]MTD43211.1 peptidylprolyl isomerase [Conexibacter sp. W3-3-2]